MTTGVIARNFEGRSFPMTNARLRDFTILLALRLSPKLNNPR